MATLFRVHKFVRNLITEWRRLRLPFADETVVVAVSGGADSTSLLLALADLKKRKKLNLRIVAAHFNHKLRGAESDEDERFVTEFSTSLGVEFLSGSGKHSAKSNLEERAREARYAFLAKAAKKFDAGIVLTAHTMNDQAETFLMNLIRGSGVDGLGGMRAVRKLGGSEISNFKSEISNLSVGTVNLYRPLLRWAERSDTEEFCRESGVSFRQDSMNDDLAFTRVRIRKTILPMLAEINPKIVETLARTAELLSEPPASAGGTVATGPQPTLKLSDLKPLDKSALYNLLRSWFRENRGNLRGLTLKHIQAVERLIHSRKSGRTVELPGSMIVEKGNGHISLVRRDLG